MEKLYISDYKEWDIAEKLAIKNGLGFEAQYFSSNDNVLNDSLVSKFNVSNKIKDISLHGPYVGLNPGSNDPIIVNKAETIFNKFYLIVKSLKIKNVILHSGYPLNCENEKLWLTNSILFWKKFIVDKRDEINLFIENVYETNPNTLKILADEINNDKFKICLDIGHCNCSSNINVEEWIEILNEKIGSVHLHNNFGKSDEHLGIDNGVINISKVLKKLELHAPNSIWTLETKEKEKSYQWLVENGYVKN